MSRKSPQNEFAIAAREEGRIYSVSELTAEIKTMVEGVFPSVWVRGEISNFHLHTSGHMYFTLKDEGAQLKAAFFKGANRRLKFEPESGMAVVAGGRLSVYEARGDYQIIVENMEPEGIGALQLKIEKLKKKLEEEGLFSPERKRPLPEFPVRIAVVTSAEGAAIRDFLKVTRSRFPCQRITIFPALVQGEDAPGQIVEAIEDANEMGSFDVLVVCRGGGSLEDLMAFNDEGVARAIAASEIPVVVGVGHERDWTIADLVADVRAATPSQAAEMVSPRRGEIQERLADAVARMARQVGGLMEDLMQSVDEAGDWLAEAARSLQEGLRADLNELAAQLKGLSPAEKLARERDVAFQLGKRLNTAIARRTAEGRQTMAAAGGRLNALSPLAVLERGYSICFALPERVVLKDASLVSPGEEIEVKLMSGKIRAAVKSMEKEKDE